MYLASAGKSDDRVVNDQVVYLASAGKSDDMVVNDQVANTDFLLPSQVWFLRVHHQCQQPLPASISHP